MGSSDPVTSSFKTLLVVISILAVLLIAGGVAIVYNSSDTILTVFGCAIGFVGLVFVAFVMFVLLFT